MNARLQRGGNFENLIGGELRGGGEWLEDRNPAHPSEIVARVPASDEHDVADALDAAAAAYPVWRDTPPAARAGVLGAAAEWLREHTTEIAGLVSAEMGKTLAEATGEVARSADFFSYYASLHRLDRGERLADGRPGVEAEVRHEPLGVVLAITPWNDPLLTPARKLAPALAAGNTVVIKPASETPISVLALALAFEQTGAPGGILNTVTGPASRLVAPLLADERLAAVTFTGSTEVGLELQRALAGRNVRLQTEMGGKNASIVLSDGDLDLAAETVCAAAFGQAGQRCTATSRLIVERSVAADLLERLVRRARLLVVAPGDAAGSAMGPLVSERQMRSVLADIEGALADGAQLALGGSRLTEGELAEGWFVAPTILTGVTRDMRIWREEVFGPVLAVSVVDSLEEAISAANDSRYGLAAALFSSSLQTSRRFIEAVEVGQVAVNLSTSGWDVHQPFGGWKLSGSGFKEQGTEALHFYTRVKTVAVKGG
ncbi:MAG TPA: aldehyde dehydrogenase family protein [Solirubrobacteraceae bacterium]|jgi:aldehyde dehydrogenase (NAD+)|nr:aldehyde dehydrogenase family protein [Solirubrobacteraceae bacterium]